jgi:Fe(3+) dicitrate transport protein
VTGFVTAFSNQTVSRATGDSDTELVAGGRTRHLGAEVSSMSRLGRAATASFDLDLTVRYGFADARFAGGTQEGERLPYAPTHTGSVALDAIIGRLGAQLALGVVGPAFSDDAATEREDVTGRTGEIPAHASLNAGVRYDVPATGLRLSLQGKNILDRPFVQARRPEGIAVGGVRQVLITVAWDLERLDRDRTTSLAEP